MAWTHKATVGELQVSVDAANGWAEIVGEGKEWRGCATIFGVVYIYGRTFGVDPFALFGEEKMAAVHEAINV